MNTNTPRYHGYRFPPEIIRHAVWLYDRFSLSFRDVEDLLAERGITVSYEAIRLWCLRFGPQYARRIKRRQGRLGDTWHLDELFVTMQGRRQYPWRGVDQEGDVIGIFLQPRRDQRAAKRFFQKLLRGQGAALDDDIRELRVCKKQQSLKSQLCSLGSRLHWSNIPMIAEPAPCSLVFCKAPLLGGLVCSL